MKIHANARTCPNSRRLLIRRIEEEGWSLIGTQVAGPLARRGRARFARSLLCPQADSPSHVREGGQGDHHAATAADDRR